MDYSVFLKKGLLYTIKCILEEVQKKQSSSSIFITVDNKHKDSLISIRLKELYPNEMCIGLLNNYEHLEVHGNYFQVHLNFNGFDELLRIPFSTIIKFEDSEKNFTLDLQSIQHAEQDQLSIEENIINISFDKK